MNTHSSHERRFFYFVLLLSKGIGPVAVSEIRQALAFSGVSDEEFGHELTKGVVPDQVLLKTKHRDAIVQALRHNLHERFLRTIDRGQFVICPEDRCLPGHYWDKAHRFRLPMIFIAKGTMPPTNVTWVAVIGSRNADADGLNRAEKAGLENARGSIVTVSGGARGVDTAATKAASSANGWTVIVPAQEVGQEAPHKKQMVLSPYAPGTMFTPGLAMARNGVVVALSSKVLIAANSSVDPIKPSGTSHAMQVAISYDVPVIDIHNK